jgi:hypothetical protein
VLKQKFIAVFIVSCSLLYSGWLQAQGGALRRMQNMGNMGGGGGGGDSLLKRVDDSITINFRYLDSSRLQKFDSSITDFGKIFPVPWHYKTLGNIGNAAESMVFSPNMQSGWDHGFHAFDLYNLRAQDVRLYNTTNAYSELGYILGSRLEQMIHLLHTQNVDPNWNLSFQYRLTNSPGFYKNQATNHNNYRFGSWYQSPNRRYQNFVVLVGNKLQSGENGGIRNIGYLDSTGYTDRFTIPTKLGGDDAGATNFFNPVLNVASRFTNATYMLRQHYDFGQKDSIVTDTTVVPLFYPRLRIEHTLTYSTYKYRFEDKQVDTAFYSTRYNMKDLKQDTSLIIFRDFWKEMINDFSIYQFPDAKNPLQFIKAGIALQTLTGNFDTGLVINKYNNLFIHGEYRNKTRNQKWDIEALGKFYLQGFNAGDYNAYISLKRFISNRIGYLQVGFQNVNRTPSFNFNPSSSFYIATPISLNKENTTNLFASLEMPRYKLKLSGNYYLVSNYSYYRNFYEPDQASSLFNVLIVTAQKQFKIGGNWNWRTWVVLQQKAGTAPVNLPLFLTRNQIGYDGNLGFKNLRTSFGLEFRYFTPYKANDYSPALGQFVYQDTNTVKMRFPEISAYLHFRIRSFTAYVHAENLNSFSFSSGGFNNNNILIPYYPSPGLQIRLGILWSFIN